MKILCRDYIASLTAVSYLLNNFRLVKYFLFVSYFLSLRGFYYTLEKRRILHRGTQKEERRMKVIQDILVPGGFARSFEEIGRASCRERV